MTVGRDGNELMFQIQKFIPKKWKECVKKVDFENNHPSTSYSSIKHSWETTTVNDESVGYNLLNLFTNFKRLDHLLKSFKTFSCVELDLSSTASHELILDSISSLLLSCTKLHLLPQGKQLHALIFPLGLERDSVLVANLVTFYSTFNLPDAQRVCWATSILDPLPWNVLISSYVKNGLFAEALSAYRKMIGEGVRPDNFTYPSVLKACGEKYDLAFGREVHESINASCRWNLFVQNALVSMYGKLGRMDLAHCLFDKMLERDVVTWNTMISCYASKGMWEEAFELFERMRIEGIEINIITWNTIASGYSRIGNFRGALAMLSQMITCGIHLDSVAIIIGLTACSHTGAIILGKEIHGLAVRSCFDGFHNVSNALITMYSRCKDLKHAYMLFRSIEPKSIITWNSMLSGYTHMDRSEEASFLFREMLISGVEPNYVTIASILSLCARVADLQHGKEFHCYIIRRTEFTDHLVLLNSLVELYARSGKLLDSKRVFDSMSRKDEVSYTSLITGYGIQGEGRAALKLFEEMINSNIKPDDITMVAVLSACSHSGLVKQGHMLFGKMLSVYGIVPRLEHFSCMVDLYGRAGMLHKAKEIITSMPYRPSSAMWATLLGACRIHGNTIIGEWVAEKLLEIRPQHSGYYVLIANLYAAAGSWNKLAVVRTNMRDLGVRKNPGCAWVDVGAGFPPFLVGDISNPIAKEIYPLLEGLTDIMKDAGYVVSDNFCWDDVLEEIQL